MIYFNFNYKKLLPEMQHNAERISKIFNDRPLNVMDNAIYWTEYVAKYRDVPKLPAFYTSWYRRLIIDVVKIVIFIIPIAFLFVIFKIVKTLLLLLCYRGSRVQTKAKRSDKKKQKRL